MMTLNANVWNEIQNVLNKENTECLEADIEIKNGSFRQAVGQFLKQIPSFNPETVTPIDGGLYSKQTAIIKEAIADYANDLRQKGEAAVMDFAGVKPYATVKAEIKLEANLSDYLASTDPATQLLLRMTNVYLTMQAELRYDAYQEINDKWIFTNGKIEKNHGIIGMIQFMHLPK